MPTVPTRRRRLAVAALTGLVLVCASSAVRPIDPLPELPPKPVVKAPVLPDPPPGHSSLPLPGNATLPLPGAAALPPLPGGGGLPPLPGGVAPAGFAPLPALPGPVNPPLPAVPTAPAAPVIAPKYVNKPDVEFDFEVTKKGRAGVRSAALWMRDAMKPDPESQDGWKEVVTLPVKAEGEQKIGFKLPADGRYEFCLQLVGENGRKSTHEQGKVFPQADLIVVLDSKPPIVKDVKLEPPGHSDQQATIRWTATDANVGEKCVKLEYEQTPGGRWVAIADNAPNNGYSPWLLNDKLPISTRVRVTVTDLAGNSTSAESAAPINLDPVVPNGRLTGVRAVDPPPVPPAVPELPAPGGGLPPPSMPPSPDPALPGIPKAKGG